MSVRLRHSVEVMGSGPRVMVFAHGYGCDKTMWRKLLPYFTDDYTVVLYDLMGCGASDISQYDKTHYATLDGHAQDLYEVVSELDRGKVILVGHSVSAMTAALFANAHPDLVDRVVMVCPSPSFINAEGYEGGFEREDILGLLETLDANFLGWSSEMAPAIMGVPDRPELGQELNNSFCQADPEIARHFAHVTFLSDHKSDVQKLKHPTLVLECSEDVIVPPAVGEWMQANMANATLKVLDATGHCPHISYPEETATAIAGFLSD